MFANRRQYRLDRSGTRTRVTADDGVCTRLWWTDNRSNARVVVQPEAIRRQFQRDVMVYLAALLVVDAEFFRYRQAPGGVSTYELQGDLGGTATLLLHDRRVGSLQFSRATAVHHLDTRSRVKQGTTVERQVTVEPMDYKTDGARTLPYRLRLRSGNDELEEWVIRRYTIGEPVPATEFIGPASTR
jgi:hypothetical protein